MFFRSTLVSHLVYVQLVALPDAPSALQRLPSPGTLVRGFARPFHLPAMAASKQSLCYLCTTSPPVHAGRCKPCNALFGRARTACKPMGNWEEFLDMSGEHMTKFFRNGHDAMGKELKGLIEETISESYSEKEMESWIKDGKYLDKEDMTKRYEGEPGE